MVKNIGISEFESLICYYKPLYASIFILEKTIHLVGDVIKWDVACKVSGTVYFQNNQQRNSVICKSGHSPAQNTDICLTMSSESK